MVFEENVALPKQFSIYSKTCMKNGMKKCIWDVFLSIFLRINHSILIDKLSLYGFRPNSLKLVTSYITTRTQITKVNDCISSARRVKCGTAQGSILGPLIYILYVNDVLKTLDNVNDIYIHMQMTCLLCQAI